MPPTAVDVVQATLPSVKLSENATVGPSHPLDPLTIQEIAQVSLAVQTYSTTEVPEIKALKFVNSNIIPPPKRDVLAHLGIPTEPGEQVVASTTDLIRRAETDFIDPVSGNNYHAMLSFNKLKRSWVVDNITRLLVGTQPQITVEELIECEKIVRSDARVQQLAAEVGVTPEQICADGWSIGWDDRWPAAQRIQQCLLFARLGEHENLYAHPMDFTPIIDVNTKRVIHIDFAPHRLAAEGNLTGPNSTTIPPSLGADSLKASGRERIPPPLKRHDYLPDLISEAKESSQINTEPLKPLHVVQPEGVGFKMTDTNVLEWQNWSMHIGKLLAPILYNLRNSDRRNAGFTAREGVVLSTITYKDGGQIRPIFYRVSLAEMVVPYAAPEHPHPRKFAFDVGEYGMGSQANELSLGCDCLGTIHYLPVAFVGHDGKPVVIKNGICIHEEDAGMLWKHTDYRVGGRAHAVRSRRLVISMVCTVANYEYSFAYHFYLDGTIELETRLSGILNVYLLAQGESASPYGTQVAPNINAHYHQHIFSIRIDPMIDGLNNTVVESDIVPAPHPTGSVNNYGGNAFISQDKRITNANQGAREYDNTKDRRWKIVNPSRKHYASGNEVAYGIMAKGAWECLKGSEGSFARERAAFAEKSVWVVKDVEGPLGSERMWPAGKYVPQTRSNPADSVLSWTKGEDVNLENEDVVLFLTIGLNHIPRPEDWPVMPAEHLKIAFKPLNFFKQNPALYLDGTHDNKSVTAFNEHSTTTNGTDGINGHTHNNCCQ